MMDNYIPTFTDVTDWNFIIYQNTTGSRSKKIIKNPGKEDEYFFKGSKELPDGEIRYPTEFWSEIVSSKIGQFLGFNVLDYNIGYNANGVQKIGCLSKSMVLNSINKLTEGKVYLTGFNPDYNPEKDKKDYTFQFIKETLLFFDYQEYIYNLIEIIVFDSIIGNSDRHQENWGIITNFQETFSDISNELAERNDKWYKNWSLKFKRLLIEYLYDKFNTEIDKIKKTDLLIESDIVKSSFSPIYDSGCCLGREYGIEKVEKILNDDQMINKYLRKGYSEIHWEGSKINHFELIANLKTEYKAEVEEVIGKVEKKYKDSGIQFIIENIDNNLPLELNNHKLHPIRKKLMIKLINLRYQKLLELK